MARWALACISRRRRLCRWGIALEFGAIALNSLFRYLPRNGHGQKAMLLCRVVLGRVGKGERGLRRPPIAVGAVRCDSVGDSRTGYYCVFDDHQTYPEYIIYFQ